MEEPGVGPCCEALFSARDGEITQIFSFVNHRSRRKSKLLIFLTGAAGDGKSTALYYAVKGLENKHTKALKCVFIPESFRTVSFSHIYRSFLRGLGIEEISRCIQCIRSGVGELNWTNFQKYLSKFLDMEVFERYFDQYGYPNWRRHLFLDFARITDVLSQRNIGFQALLNAPAWRQPHLLAILCNMFYYTGVKRILVSMDGFEHAWMLWTKSARSRPKMRLLLSIVQFVYLLKGPVCVFLTCDLGITRYDLMKGDYKIFLEPFEHLEVRLHDLGFKERLDIAKKYAKYYGISKLSLPREIIREGSLREIIQQILYCHMEAMT